MVLAGDVLELLAFPDAGPGQILDAHPQLVQALTVVTDGGGRVVYVVGNHDGALAWDDDAVRQVTSRLDLRMGLAAEVQFAGAAGQPPARVRVEHGHQLDPYNRFVDQRNALDTPMGHHIVAQVLPQVQELGAGWLKDTSELAEASGFPSYLASRLAYRQLGRHLWWLLIPVLVLVGLRVPEVVELVSGHAATDRWAGRAQVLAVGALLDLGLLAAVVWFLARRMWRSISVLGLGESGSGQNLAARQRAIRLVNCGYDGLITGHTHQVELRGLRGGFYANTGSCTAIVEAIPARLRLRPAYLRTQQICWVECVMTHRLSARLVTARYPLSGATGLERLVTTGRRPTGQPLTVMQHWPDDRPLSTHPAPARQPPIPGPSGAALSPARPAAAPVGSPAAPVGAAARQRPAPGRWRTPGRLAPTLVTLLVAGFGLASLVSALVPRSRDRVSDLALFVPEPATAAAAAATEAAGLLLIYLAHGLRRRKRRAWRIAVTATTLVLVIHPGFPGG